MLRYGVHRTVSKVCAAVVALSAGAASADTVDILALGDSLTQGYGLVAEEGFVPQLQGWLDAAGYDARVVNGGVSGDTSAGGLARVEWSLTPEIDAMIVALGGNDILRGIDPAATRANIDGILQVAAREDVAVLLIGHDAPGNYGADYKAAFDAIFPELSEQYGTLYLDSFFAGLRGPDGTLARPETVMQSDRIHPNAEGVRRIVDTIGPAVGRLIERAAAD